MNKKLPGATRVSQPSNRQAVAASHVKPGVTQLKTAVSAQSVKRPAAPTAFRPQPTPKVLQTKSSSARRPPAAHSPRAPVAPPVYRPEAKKVVQPKVASAQRKSPTPPPPYRPGQKRVAQPKMAAAAQAPAAAKTPPVYRPRPAPKVLQMKQAQPAAVAQNKGALPRPTLPDKPAPVKVRRPGAARPSATVQRAVDVSVPSPGPSWLPDHGDSLERDAKTARAEATKYWAYLEEYESVWGRYPWEPRQAVKGEYQYERDPKQVARDRSEFLKARAQLREESELLPLAKAAANGQPEVEQVLVHAVKNNTVVRETLARVAALPNGRKEALTNWALVVFLHETAGLARALVNGAGTVEARIERLTQLNEQWGGFFNRQVIHPDDIRRFAERTDWLYDYLTSGLQSLAYGWQTHPRTDRPRFVEDVLRHDKGYPRTINFINQFVPTRPDMLYSIVNEFLSGFSNTDLYTQRRSSLPLREQIRKKFSEVGGTPEFWEPILGRIGRELPELGYDADAVAEYIRQNAGQLRNALAGLVPPDAVTRLISPGNLEDACRKAGML